MMNGRLKTTERGFKTLLENNNKNGFLAIDFGGTKVIVALLNLKGDWLAREKKIIAHQDSKKIITEALKLCQKLVSEKQCTISGIGISTIGVVNGDYLKLVPTIKNWDQINLRESFELQFPDVPIYIENDVKAAAYGEILNGALKNTKNGLYLNLGTGVAVGLTYGEKVVKGSHGAAGEVGYLLNSVDSNVSFLNGHAPFEEVAGGQGIARQITQITSVEMEAKEFWNKDFPKESELFQLQKHILKLLSFQLSNLCVIWDPEVVAIGGGMEAQFSLFANKLKSALRDNVPFPPKLLPAYYKQDASLNGIAQLLLSKANSSK